MFRHTRLDFWGVVTCVLMLSISSLFYIIAGQFLFSKLLRIAPISGYVPGLDVHAKFAWALPIVLVAARLAPGAPRRLPLPRDAFLEEIGKDYVRTARAKGLSGRRRGAVPPRAAQRADPDRDQRRGIPCRYVFLGSLVFESVLRHPRARATYVIDAITAQDFAIVRTMVFRGRRCCTSRRSS